MNKQFLTVLCCLTLAAGVHAQAVQTIDNGLTATGAGDSRKISLGGTLNFGTASRTAQFKDDGLYISRLLDGAYYNSITGMGHFSMAYATRGNHSFSPIT